MISSFSGEYRFLSNFYYCTVVIDGVIFLTSEHAFQAWKMINEENAELVRQCCTPGDAKKLARSLPCRQDWELIKVEVMTMVCREKFRHEPLRSKLLATGNQELVEGNTWHDVFWGVCNGRGQNMLGRILMDIRAQLLHAI